MTPWVTEISLTPFSCQLLGTNYTGPHHFYSDAPVLVGAPSSLYSNLTASLSEQINVQVGQPCHVHVMTDAVWFWMLLMVLWEMSLRYLLGVLTCRREPWRNYQLSPHLEKGALRYLWAKSSSWEESFEVLTSLVLTFRYSSDMSSPRKECFEVFIS